ncbi:MAG: glycine/betaine ABC transporter substrate-binding protein [Oscillospiraceae bacterium]|nr:glycine/betaine ABC transporter substrate-binding protein [Oscillospiraceae bacterium]
MRKLQLLFALLLIFGVLAGCSADKETIVVGAKYFTEQEILANVLELLIEEHTKLGTVSRTNMSSHVIFAAVTSGAIDVYIDYTGTIFGSYLNHTDDLSAQEVFDISSRELEVQHDLRLLSPLGFNNTFCLAVRPETAEQFNLRTFSDLALVSSELIFGGSAEILYRYDGLPNLKLVYNMSFKDELEFADEARYQAIVDDIVQVTEAFSTDGLLMAHDLVVLEDDKHFFPPYEGVVVIRGEIAEKHPELVDVLSKISGVFTDYIMRNLNYRVDVQGEDPREVARSFLKDNGFIG